MAEKKIAINSVQITGFVPIYYFTIFVRKNDMRLIVPVIFIIVFVGLIDLYLYKALRLLCRNINNKKVKKIIYITHWIIPVITILIYLVINAKVASLRDPSGYRYLFTLFGLFLIIYVPKLIVVDFHLIEDLSFLIVRIFKRQAKRFLFITKTGILISLIPAIFIIRGMVFEKNDIPLTHVEIVYPNLPPAFDKIKIIHFSDWHLGSNGGKKQVEKIVSLINSQNPDLIFFTGDLVNNFAEETDGFKELLTSIKARYGKFSILGNHDYGDYYKWTDTNEKKKNLDRIKQFEKDCGFRLLLNESDSICIGNDRISIIGVENWGKPPFKQYGNIKKAASGTETFPFKILLSHDPDYWRAEIVKNYNIDLTLSGHTHGMQIGFNIFGKLRSPSSLRFKEWKGLYSEGNKKLYVNVGVGYIGFPARIGMPPEITVITLKRK